MYKQACAPYRGRALGWWRIGLSLGIAAAVLGANAACEDKGVGRPCDVRTDAGGATGAYAIGASDCPSRLCVKPAVQPGVSVDLVTSAYCTIQCSSDTDCDGQTRDPANSLDKRCLKGFVCAPIFDKGDLCCTKLCLCRDFYSASVGPATPDACKPDSGVTCSK
jgi:hypothetical protein